MIANPKNIAMKNPLTQEEKRRLLQLLYLEKQSHNEHSEDFAESKPSVYTWPPAVPEDYDELLACGPYEIWSIAEGGAYELAEELLANNDPNELDSYFLIRLAIGAACREDIQATQRFVDMSLVALEKFEGEKRVDPVIFEWHNSLLRYCQLGLACQVIEDQFRKTKVRERLANLLKGVIQWFSDHGRTPLPDCAHEMRILLDLGWEEEVRIVLRHLPQIYNFIGSQPVNLRLMNAFLDHGMQEHIFTMIGASSDTRARDNFRLAAVRAALDHNNFALALAIIATFEKDLDEGNGSLERIAEHASKHGKLHFWKTFLDLDSDKYQPTLDQLRRHQWMVAVSALGNGDLRQEIWAVARDDRSVLEGQDESVVLEPLKPYKLVIAAFAGDRDAVQGYLQDESMVVERRLLEKLRRAAILNDMEFAVEWAQKRLEGEGNTKIMESLNLEQLRFRAHKPNQLLKCLDYYIQFLTENPDGYEDFRFSLTNFIRRRVPELAELPQYSDFLKTIGSPYPNPYDNLNAGLDDMYHDAISKKEIVLFDYFSTGIRGWLINRFGIREKMDMFESGRGWP